MSELIATEDGIGPEDLRLPGHHDPLQQARDTTEELGQRLDRVGQQLGQVAHEGSGPSVRALGALCRDTAHRLNRDAGQLHELDQRILPLVHTLHEGEQQCPTLRHRWHAARQELLADGHRYIAPPQTPLPPGAGSPAGGPMRTMGTAAAPGPSFGDHHVRLPVIDPATYLQFIDHRLTAPYADLFARLHRRGPFLPPVQSLHEHHARMIAIPGWADQLAHYEHTVHQVLEAFAQLGKQVLHEDERLDEELERLGHHVQLPPHAEPMGSAQPGPGPIAASTDHEAVAVNTSGSGRASSPQDLQRCAHRLREAAHELDGAAPLTRGISGALAHGSPSHGFGHPHASQFERFWHEHLRRLGHRLHAAADKADHLAEELARIDQECARALAGLG